MGGLLLIIKNMEPDYFIIVCNHTHVNMVKKHNYSEILLYKIYNFGGKYVGRKIFVLILGAVR